MRTHISVLALAVALPALAQEVIVLEEISLSANFDEVEVAQTGAQVEVLEGDEIFENQSLLVSDFLGDQVGVSVSRSGPLGGNTAVLIRGTRQYENKVFIDGVDVSDPSLIQSYYNFANMTMGDVERIEVVKGSQSALYGSNAVGGVIDITSKGAQHDGFGGSASIEYGSYETLRASTTLAHGGANHDVAVTFTRAQSEGFSAANEDNGNTEADAFVGNRVSFKGSYDVTNSIEVGASGFSARSEADYDGFDFFTSMQVDADNVANSDEQGGRVYVKYHTDMMSHELSYSGYAITREYDEPFANYTYEGSRSTFAYAGDVEFSDMISANLRLEHIEESYEQSGDYGEATEEATMDSAAFGLNVKPVEALDLNLAVRYDDHEIFGDQTSYRLAAAYHLNDALTLKASYGTGYRAPSLYEMNYNVTADLEPETSTSYDFGAEYRMDDRLVIGANYFNIETDNLIEYSGFWPDDYYANVEGISTRSGVEVYGQVQLNDAIGFDMGYTQITAEDASGERLTNIPASEFHLGADASYAGFNLGADMKMVSDVLDRAGEKFDDYNLVNARLGYELGNGEVYIRGENLLDEQYETVRGFGTSDRAYYVGYSVDF